MMVYALAAVVLGFLLYQHLQSKLWHKKFELLCTRIQAPEQVVFKELERPTDTPEAVSTVDDADYWGARGVSDPED